MQRPGEMDVILGWVWIIMGGLSMVATIVLIGTISLWSFVPVGVGSAQVGRGMSRRKPDLKYELPADRKRREDDAALAAMVYLAADKGAVTPERSAHLDKVAQQMFGGRPSAERVRALAEKAFDLETLLARQASQLRPEARVRVLEASRAVAAADSAMDERLAIVTRLMDAA